MAIATTPILTITQAELDRANLETVQLRDGTARLQAVVATQEARIAQLEAQLAQQPTTPPVTPPATPSGKTSLYVDGGTLRTKNGAACVVRGIEMMYGQNSNTLGPVGVCALVKALGANTVSPLFEPGFTTTNHVKGMADAALAAGLLIGVNSDHVENGRNWLSAAPMVSLLNNYANLFIECEIETAEVGSGAQWRDAAIGLVRALRGAGHKNPIKVGAPQGGRRVEYPLADGAAVLAADPLRNVLFTWQAYWSKTGTWYQGQAGVPNGIAGTKEAIRRVGASGLCFLVGLDYEDDVGETGELELMDECFARGVGYQHWVLTNDHIASNNMVNGGLSLPNITDTGRMLQTKMLAQRVLPQL